MNIISAPIYECNNIWRMWRHDSSTWLLRDVTAQPTLICDGATMLDQQVDIGI